MAALDINKFGALASPVTAKDGQPLTIAEYIAFDANNKQTVKTVLDDLKNAIEQGGGSGGDVTINDATLGGGLSFKNDKIELNLEDSLKIENDKLGIKAPYGSGLNVSSSGVYLNVDPNHFEIGSNMLKLKDTTSGGGSYSLQEATDKILGGIYIHTGVLENQTQFIIPINKQEGTNEKLTKFGISVLNDDAFENDSVLRIKGNWWINNKYQNAVNNSEFILGTNGNSLPEDINNFVIFGNKDDVPGQRVGYFDNIVVTTEQGWPVSGEVSGHIVVNKSANVVTGNTTRYTHSQMLYITNSTGNDYKIFMRDGKGRFTEEGTEGVSEWRPWKEIQGMAILQGSNGNFNVTDEDLNKVVDNGIYAGVYKTDDYSMGEENMLITGVETFTMIVVNNYAMAAVFDEIVSSLNMHFPKQVIQYKISSPLYGTPVANDSVDTPDPNLYKGKVQMRTGVHHNTTNTYVFTEWESIGGSVPIV